MSGHKELEAAFTAKKKADRRLRRVAANMFVAGADLKWKRNGSFCTGMILRLSPEMDHIIVREPSRTCNTYVKISEVIEAMKG